MYYYTHFRKEGGNTCTSLNMHIPLLRGVLLLEDTIHVLRFQNSTNQKAPDLHLNIGSVLYTKISHLKLLLYGRLHIFKM